MENIKKLLGDSYHEGITLEEVDNFLKDKKMVDLSTGKYVDKDKYDRLNDDLKNSKTSYEELATKTKNYDELVKFKEESDAKAKQDEIVKQLKDNGFKDEFVDFGLFQVQSGHIKQDDKFADNIKQFLNDNKQYQKPAAPNLLPPNLSTIISGQDNSNSNQPKQVTTPSWNKNRGF